MNDQWYYEQEGRAQGPLAQDQLLQLAQRGTIGRATLVWRDGMADWTTLESLGLWGDAPTPSPPPLPPPPPVEQPGVQPVKQQSGSRWKGPVPQARSEVHPPAPAMAGPKYRASGRATPRWPIFAAAGVVALLAAVAVGWIAREIFGGSSREANSGVVASSDGARSEKGAKRSRAQRAEASSSTAAKDESETTPPVATRPESSAGASSVDVTPAPSDPANETPAPPPTAADEPPSRPADAPMPVEPPKPSETPKSAATTTPSASSSTPRDTPKTRALFQKVDVQRTPKFSILGTVMVQDLRYQLLSELHIGEPDQEKVRKVEQVVRDTRLLKADDLSRAMFEDSLAKIKGAQFYYKVNERGEVLDWMAGPAGGGKAAAVEPMGAKGFLVTSVMDEDGWKELAYLSLLSPDLQNSKGTWKRSMSHNFGPLGSWYGETAYVPKGTREGILRIDFAHNLAYKPPRGDAAGLPFVIREADLKPVAAGGTVYFDTKKGRVAGAQESFLVKGMISAELLGAATPVEVEEQQAIALRVLEQNPWKK